MDKFEQRAGVNYRECRSDSGAGTFAPEDNGNAIWDAVFGAPAFNPSGKLRTLYPIQIWEGFRSSTATGNSDFNPSHVRVDG